MKPVLAFIGAGNLAECLISGLLAKGYPPKALLASHPREDRCQLLSQKYAIHAESDNQAVARLADRIIVCVKPGVVAAVLTEITSILKPKCCLISVAAGIPISLLQQAAPEAVVVRAMPNIGARIGQSVTGLFSSDAHCPRADIEEIFDAVGESHWLENESLMDAITALSGSGPAFCLYILEVFRQAALNLGLSDSQARAFIVPTWQATGALAASDWAAMGDLRKMVTSKGGTTEAGLGVLANAGLADTLNTAVMAAYRRAQELARSV